MNAATLALLKRVMSYDGWELRGGYIRHEGEDDTWYPVVNFHHLLDVYAR